MSRPVSVSRLNGYIRSKLDGDPKLRDLLVAGEISNLTNHYRSGHLYFVLKDETAAVKAVMFRSNAQHLRFEVQNGMKVVVRCTVSLYERDGSYQIYVSELIPDGTGALYLQYEQLKAKLEREGLFDPAHKRPLPRFPRAVGIVTSPTGAAVRDLCNVLGRRWPLARIVFSPATVQGDGAARSIIEGMRRLVEDGTCDVMIIGRGGGSIEDLWGFNDEALARAVYCCPVPVISAVGHETDFTICDFVADLRAPTPSAAAELAVPDQRDVMQALDSLALSMRQGILGRVSRAQSGVDQCARRIAAHSPRGRVEQMRLRVESCRQSVRRSAARTLEEKRRDVLAAAKLIDSLSPLHILSRGYGVLLREGKALRSVEELHSGETFTARLSDGLVEAVAGTITKWEENRRGGEDHDV